MKKEHSKKTDTLRNDRGVGPTPSPPIISCGDKNKKLLEHLLKIGDSRLNVKEYARINKIARSTVYEILNRLERKELVSRKLADNKITKKGKIYLETTNRGVGRGVGNSRWGCRDFGNLSTHYHTFVLPIKDRSKFKIERLDTIKNEGYKENRLANLHQIIIDFQDAKIVINPKQVRINLFDINSKNVEDSDIECLSRAIEYAELMRKIGVETEGAMVEKGHWARVESVLSDFIYNKVDSRYFLTLKSGAKFWIDHSDGKEEDETDNKIVRKRVDDFLNQVASNDYDLSDISKVKESLGFITKLESMRLSDKIEENKLERLRLKKENFKEKELNLGVSYIN